MLVTIVMAVYNGEKYLKEALESAIAQTYQNTEIIIVNDGSTDSTKMILERIHDQRVRVIHLEKNQGAANALNVGISQASGSWIAIQDSDDFMYPSKIEDQVTYITENTLLVGVGTFVRCISDDSTIPQIELDGMTASRNAERTGKEIRNKIYWGCHLTHSSMMFSKEVFWEVGGYDTRFTIAYDYDLWLKLLEKGDIEKVPKVLLDYRIHSGSLSNKDSLVTMNEIQIASSRAIFRNVTNDHQLKPQIIVTGPENACKHFKTAIAPFTGLDVESMIFKNWKKKIPQAVSKLKDGKVAAIMVLDGYYEETILRKLRKNGFNLNHRVFQLYNMLT